MPDFSPRPDWPEARRRAMLPPPFACSWTARADDAAWMHVAGELDIATTPELELALSEPQAQAQLVVLDLRELEFMDAASMQVIVRATHHARRIGRRLLLVRSGPVIDRVFALTGTTGDIVDGAVGPAEAPRRALLRLAAEGGAS